MGYEDYRINQIDKKRTEDAAIKKAQQWTLSAEDKKIVEQFSELRDTEGLDIRDPFFNPKRESDRAKDEAYVAKRTENFKIQSEESKTASKISSAFEYVIAHRINESGWFGNDLRAQLTSRLDDIANGIDMYLERIGSDSSGPIGLSIDVTFAENPEVIKDKFKGIKEEYLNNGKLARLSYYKPIDEAARAKMEGTTEREAIGLPKVVIGVGRAKALDTIKVYAKGGTQVADLVSMAIMIYQIERQLKTFAEYTREKSRKSPALANRAAAYTAALADFQQTVDAKFIEKSGKPLNREELAKMVQTDPVTKTIIDELNKMLDEVYK